MARNYSNFVAVVASGRFVDWSTGDERKAEWNRWDCKRKLVVAVGFEWNRKLDYHTGQWDCSSSDFHRNYFAGMRNERDDIAVVVAAAVVVAVDSAAAAASYAVDEDVNDLAVKMVDFHIDSYLRSFHVVAADSSVNEMAEMAAAMTSNHLPSNC